MEGSRHKLMGLSQTHSVRTLVLVGVLATLSCSLVLYLSGGAQLHYNFRRGFQSLWSGRDPDHRHEPPWRETMENSVRTLYFVYHGVVHQCGMVSMALYRIKNQHTDVVVSWMGEVCGVQGFIALEEHHLKSIGDLFWCKQAASVNARVILGFYS